MSARVEAIRSLLEGSFAAEYLVIDDDSHKHEGHAGARDGRGHFSVTIVAPEFAGQSAIARHRMVYNALGDLMQTDIHALSISASAPDEL